MITARVKYNSEHEGNSGARVQGAGGVRLCESSSRAQGRGGLEEQPLARHGGEARLTLVRCSGSHCHPRGQAGRSLKERDEGPTGLGCQRPARWVPGWGRGILLGAAAGCRRFPWTRWEQRILPSFPRGWGQREFAKVVNAFV